MEIDAAATKAAKRKSKRVRQRAAASERVQAEAEAALFAAKEEALLADAADQDALAVNRREQAALEQLLIESRRQLLELQDQEQALLARIAKRAGLVLADDVVGAVAICCASPTSLAWCATCKSFRQA